MTAGTAVVTGAAGFIGSHMVDLLLDRGFHVRGIDSLITGRKDNLIQAQNNTNFTLHVVDLRELKSSSELFDSVDYVFHFAGIGDIVPSIDNPINYMSTNVMGTVCALEASRNAGVRKFVYAASSSCYGVATELPTTENASISSQYPYALSKYQGEEAVLHWGRVYNLPVVSLRIFNAYGPRARTTGAYGAVFGVFLAQKLAGKPFTVVGDGSQTRDFVFVTDLAQAFLAAAESNCQQEIYNIGNGKPQSINRLVELLGGDVVNVAKRPGEPDCTWADITKARNQLHWDPNVSFEDGVQIMLDNIDYWRTAPVWDPESITAATAGWFEALSETD